MIEANKRNAVYQLYLEGMPKREIARRMHLSPITVRSIIDLKGEVNDGSRTDKIIVDEVLLKRLYAECNGFIQRIYEKLKEEEKITIGYSTLTRLIRQMGLDKQDSKISARVPDLPGEEMQHDTSVYRIEIGAKTVKIVASLLYFRYSKMRYLKFYRFFNRFQMQCFFHEALTFFGYTAKICVIDNTNLARLRGTGKNALICPEMDRFSKRYGFLFSCHAIGHANRKAGNERSFYTVETNFFPGRIFSSFTDLNQQALDWATKRMAQRPVAKTGLIPKDAFVFEQAYLIKLPANLAAPYLPHHRIVDQYGYIAFGQNYYHVPLKTKTEVTLLQYPQHFEVYYQKKKLLSYSLPEDGTKNEKFALKGHPLPSHQPNNRKNGSQKEEQALRTCDQQIHHYLDFALQQKGLGRHRFIRGLYHLYKKTAKPLFIEALKRALKYRIVDLNTLERMILLQITDSAYEMPSAWIDDDLRERETFKQGQFSDDVDLSVYDTLWEEDHE